MNKKLLLIIICFICFGLGSFISFGLFTYMNNYERQLKEEYRKSMISSSRDLARCESKLERYKMVDEFVEDVLGDK